MLLWSRVKELLLRAKLDRETREELASHVEMAVANKIQAGLEPDEARRQARIELGDPQRTREELAETRSGFLLESLLRDAAYAVRMLRKRPGFTLVSILTIALGVGGSSALFALVRTVILKPLPFPEPESLVRVFDTNPRIGVERTDATTGNVADWRRRAHLFRGIAAYYTMGRTLTAGGESEVISTAQVGEDFFALLGVEPAVGRTFTHDEMASGRFNSAMALIGVDPVAVLSHGLWRRRFGGDPGVVGRTVLLERRPFRIVGVMPGGFWMPRPDVELFIPWDISGVEPRDQHYVSVVARLRREASLARGEEELRAVAQALAAEHPDTNEGWSVRLSSLREDVVGDAGRALWLLLGAVGLLLLAACANVALLSLARGLERGREASIRLALGASRARLWRQFLVESFLLTAAGGAIGALIAVAALELLKRRPGGLPRIGEVDLDPYWLLFVLGVIAVAALLAGLPDAWQRTRVEPGSGLRSESPRVAGHARHAVSDGLVVAEVAMAVALLAAAGLLIRSYARLRAVDPGFDPRGVLVAPIFLDTEAYRSGEKSRTYYASLIERLEAVPGVLSAGGATALPTSPLGPDFARPVWPEEAPPDPRERIPAWVRMVTTRYFETLGMRLVAGRAFGDEDGPSAPRRVIVSQGLARRLWPSRDAVGRRLMIDYSTSGTYPYEVVGVVNDVHFSGPRSEPRLEVYVPHAQRPYLILNVAIRIAVDPVSLIPTVRGILHELDPGKPAHGFHVLSDWLAGTYARDRQTMLILSAFAATAVLLSLLGVHAMLMHRVRERTREIGVRMAVGAGRSQVLSWIAGHGLKLILMGATLGAALAVASARAVSSLLFGVSLLEPVGILAAAALPVTGVLVSLHPAWRATRIDVAEVLRQG
jgi:putative ABC transport system permease protein